jgi:chloramphenicol-sensitive protein RarD
MHLGVVYAALAYTAWGLLPVFFKQLAHVGPLEVVMHRTVWALVFLLGVMLVRQRWVWLSDVLRRPRVLGAFALSAALLATNWMVYVWAVQNAHMLDASLGYFILPLVNVALGFVFLHERPRRGQWLAVVVAAAGVLWLTLETAHMPWIALAIAISFGSYGLLRKVASLGALEGLALETLLLSPVALGVLAWSAWHGEGAIVRVFSTETISGHQSLTTLGWLLLAGPLTAVPLLLFAAGARRVSLATLGILQYISPSLQLALGVWLYGEPFSASRALGFCLIWAALLVYGAEGWVNSRQTAR